MILLISPAKTLDFSGADVASYSEPRLLDHSAQLVALLRRKSARELMQLMSVSERLADINYHRYQHFATPFTPENAKQAILAFKGDVYTGLQAEDFSADELAFAQRHLRILSGLYGVLRPLDLMQAYRLEMGTRLSNGHGKNLYEFWGDEITEVINQDLAEQGEEVVINLASQEYFRAVHAEKLKGRLYHIHFKENRDGQYKVIAFHAKKARGLMCRFVIQNRLRDPADLKSFDLDGYFFNEDLSSETDWVFIR